MLRRRDGARIDLDRHLGRGREPEGAAQHRHQAGELVVGQEGGRAAAEVDLRDGLPVPEFAHVQIDLALERLEVRLRPVMVTRDHLVARAVVADLLAERDVHIDRHRARAGDDSAAVSALPQRLPVVLGREGLDEAIGRRVRGVARPGNVEPAEQVLRDRDGRTAARGVRVGLGPFQCVRRRARQHDRTVPKG
jgi:hypothetical protein